MKRYLLSLLLFALCMLVTAAGAATIVGPGYDRHVVIVPPGSTGIFPVSVGGLENAEAVYFNLTFDNTLLSVENVSANNTIPGSTVEPNIDNTTGWVQVAVTNTEGITVNETWPLTPLVDITFRATENEGESTVAFAETPAYSLGFEPVDFDLIYEGSIAVRNPSTVQAPSGTLSYGQPDTFSVGVNNVTDATEIWFELMYDGSYLIVDDIVPVLSGAVITDAYAMNGVHPYELQEFGLEAVPEEVRQNLQQHPGSNYMWVELEIPGGLTVTDYTEIVDITFRPTNLTGTSEIITYASWDVGEEWHSFDLEIPGQIVTNGGGSYPSLGEFRAPSATIDAGSQKVLPIMVRSLNNADSAFFWAKWNSTIINVTSLSLNATAQNAGVTLDSWWSYSYTYEPTGYLHAYLGNMSSLNTASWTPVLDLTVKANATGQTPVNISGSVYMDPRENVTIMYPAASIENGVISVIVPEKADLRGTLVDPVRYVKKYADGSLHFTQTMVIENIGVKTVTEAFEIQAEFGSRKEPFTIEDDIAPGANITYHMTMNIVPGYGETDVVITNQGYERWYDVTTGGDISVGDYTIGLGIDVNDTVDEINEENNHIETQAEITYPDLIPVWSMEFVSGIPSSNTTLLGTSLTPGTWEVTFGAKNIGNVSAVPTTLNYTVNGGVPTVYTVPALGPGESWNQTITINVGRAVNAYRVEVNANRTEEVETNYGNNVDEKSIGSVNPVTVVLPKVSGEAGKDIPVAIVISNISATAPVTAFQIPLIYDPTVCYNSTPVSAIPGVTVTSSYGRLTLTGTDLTALTSDTEIASFMMKARTDSGRISVLDSQTNAYVKTTGGAFLELEITRGEFAQENKTDAAVSIFASPNGPAGRNQTVSVTVQNRRSNPVTVSANLTANDDMFWEMQGISLAGRASRTFTVKTWKPVDAGAYSLNATIAGDDIPVGNSASRSIAIDNYELNITDHNRQYWDAWYGYNKSVLKNEYFTLGTYFTANQTSMVNATLAITYPNGTPVNLTDNSVFEFYYYYPAERSVYAYDSGWNSVSWYYIRPKQLETFNYSITLEARERTAYVNGTLTVREPNVDIKVMNTTMVTNETSKTLAFPVFVRTPSEGKNVQILLAAGADGRTLQGLTSLIGYPHGCPEQTMSPALVALRVKEYYAERGALTDTINATLQSTMQKALDRMNVPDGDNAQQLAGRQYGDGSGGWAWGKSSTPSMFYTLYPNYVITELKKDIEIDPGFWNVDANMSGIDLNASANWLIQKQKPDGHWHGWGYISNDVEWTGFISENLASEYPYLNATMQEAVNASLNDSCTWLLAHDYTNEDTQALSYAILGLVAIRDHGIGNDTAINVEIGELKTQLLGKRESSGAESYWNDKTKWGTYEPTASAILALHKAGVDPVDLSPSISHLIGNRAGRSYSGGWGSTRTSAAVINTLTEVVPQADMDFTVNVEIKSPAGAAVWSGNNITFNQTSFSSIHKLTEGELNILYGGAPNGTATVIISGKTDADPEKIAKLSVSIDSFEQVPKSIAIATIPEQYIDPIATDFDLQIVAPAKVLKEGDSGDVGFTVNNDRLHPINQSVMIIEIPISNAVNFTGSALGSDTAYYRSDSGREYISHMYNATAQTLYLYPGSDDESRPSVSAGESETFFVPLKFGAAGNTTVEARVYPMYNDTWMALGSGGTYVLGYGNVTLAAVNETDAPVAADFYVDGGFIGSGMTNVSTLLEGSYPVAIKSGDIWINSTVNVAPSDSIAYTAHFASDRNVPYIAQAEGTAGEIRIMPPAIEDTTDDASPERWNAARRAMKSFNSTIASSGGRATISVKIPTLTRTIGTVELNDTVVVSVHNASGWFVVPSSGYSLEGGVLTLFNIDTADVDQISIGFEGRKLGDVDNNDDRIRLTDAIIIAQSLVPGEGELTGNAELYGDIDDSGRIRLQDAIAIAQYLIPGQYDDNYQPL